MAYRASPIDVQEMSRDGCPIANADSFFPRPHPSAASSAKLGLASLALGALAGIPAILMSRLVLREIVDGKGLYTGEREAKTGLALGWTGTLFSLSLLVYWFAVWSPAVGGVAIGAAALAAGAAAAGKYWLGAPAGLRALGARPLRSAWPLWVGAAGTVVAGATGIQERWQRDVRQRIEAAAACEREIGLAERAFFTNQFDAARDHLGSARGACTGPYLAHAEELDASVPQRETEYQQRLAREAAERRAQVAAARESKAAANFQQRSRTMLERVDAVGAKVSQAGWLEARDELDLVARWLREFEGTKVETSEQWLRLKARLDEVGKRIAPQVEKAERTRAAQAEAKRKREQALEKRREAAAAAREASLRVRCCDGTLSGRCLCNGSHRGCCSHHGGICGCED